LIFGGIMTFVFGLAWLVCVVRVVRKSRRNALNVSARVDEYLLSVGDVGILLVMLLIVLAFVGHFLMLR
jgi:hypothetical protein